MCGSAVEQGQSTDLHATLTIGADGIRSTVARQVDAPVSRRGISAGAVLYRYFHDLPAEGYEWSYGDQAATGFIPTNDGHVRLRRDDARSDPLPAAQRSRACLQYRSSRQRARLW